MEEVVGCWPAHRDCEHRAYIGREVTYCGLPARIVKNAAGNAFIAPRDMSLGLIPYSWMAVWNICDNCEGRFE